MLCLISVRSCPILVPTTGSKSALLGPRSVSGCCFARRLTWTDRDLRDQLGRSGNMRTSLNAEVAGSIPASPTHIFPGLWLIC